MNLTVALLSSNPDFNSAVSEISDSTNRYGNIHSNKRKQVDGNALARQWAISSDKARSTMKKATHREVRSALHPNLSCRYPINDRMLLYKFMPRPLFSDTLQSGTKSTRVNIYGQAYCTSFGWSRFHPMRKKGEAQKTLSMIFKCGGVSPRMIVYSSKEQSLGGIKRKCCEVGFHLVSSDPHSHWQIAAEGCIKELKKAYSQKTNIHWLA